MVSVLTVLHPCSDSVRWSKGEAFTCDADYFNGHEDDNAICYLLLANCIIHEVNKKCNAP